MRLLKNTPLLLLLIAISCPVYAQSTLDQATFESECPDLVTEGFESVALESLGAGFEDFLINYVGESLTTGTGTFVPNTSLNVFDFYVLNIDNADGTDIGINFEVESNFVVVDNNCATYNLNDSASHVGFDYVGGSDSTIEFFDADGNSIAVENLPDTDSLPSGDQDGDTGNDPFVFWGFVAPEGTTVSSFEICPGEQGLGMDNLSTGFCEPADETCFGQIEGLKDLVSELIDTATGCELHNLEAAYDCLCIMQDPIFWQTDNRLSCYGSSFFIGGAYTIAYLECSGHPDAGPVVGSVLDLLNCIVDNEIEYAIENDGNDCYLYYAEAYSDVAETLYEDLDLPVVSALAYRLAWLHAFYSTY